MKSVIKSARTVDEAVNLALQDLGLTKDSVEIEVLEEPSKGLLGIFGSKDAIVKVTEKVDFKIDINDIYGEKTKLDFDKDVKEHNLQETKEESIEENKQESFEYELRNDSDQVDDEDFSLENEKAQEAGEEKLENLESTSNSSAQENISSKDVKDHLEYILDAMHIKARVEAQVNDETTMLNLVDISEEDTGIIIGRKGETLDSLQYILSLIANKNSKDFSRVTLDVAKYRLRRKEAIENKARKLAFRVIKSKKSMSLEPMNSYERRIVHYALQDYKEVETVSQGSFPNRKVVIKYKD